MRKNIRFITLIFIFIVYSNTQSQWQVCSSFSGNVLSFSVTDSVLIAGTYGSGVYYTSDGVNWTFSANGMTNTRIISMLSSGNKVYAGSESGGVYCSSNSGINWIPVNNGLTSNEIHTMSTYSGKLYAGTNTGVFMTTDNGSNWSLFSTSNVGNVIYASVAYNDRVIATSSYGIFITSNGGNNWASITSGTSGSIYCLSRYNGIVYAGSSSQGVFKTSNDGSNWVQLNSGLPTGKAVRTVYCESDKIYAAVYNSGGIYYLPTSGSSWIAANEGLTQLTCYSVVVFKNYVYAGTTTGIFRRAKNEFSAIQKVNQVYADEFKLHNNYPNPFNSQTVLKFTIPVALSGFDIKMDLFDVNGRMINVLVNEKITSGTYTYNLNTNNLSSGNYFIKLSCDNLISTKKITLLK